MKRHGQLWQRLVSFENIWAAYRKAIRGKGMKPYTLNFTNNLEHHLLALQDALVQGTYHPGAYRTFYIFEPKKRMISAAPFIDRMVHHCLINVIGPIFEAGFVAQSFANQIGKGTHRAIREVQNAMRLHRYVLHCDIRKYFPSIDHAILKTMLRRKIKDQKVLRLADLIIDCSNPQEFVPDYFPGDDLFTPLERRKGLPIGNLTSQFFANVYLNGLDHFVKQDLHCRFYARYVDDMVVADSDKEHLWQVRDTIGNYLETLRLRLHPKKQHVRPATEGLRFLGQMVYPDRRLLPKENIRRLMRRMRRFKRQLATKQISSEQIRHSLQSWLGHAKQANTFKLRQTLMKKMGDFA